MPFTIRNYRRLTIIFTLLFSACATGSSIVSKSYPSVPIDHVEILFSAPAKSYEEIGMVNAHGRGYGSFSANQQKAVERLKEEAASIGADAILLMGPAQQSSIVGGTYQSYGNTGSGFGVAGPAGDAMLNAIAIKYK